MNEEDIGGSIVFCRFSDKSYQYNLTTKLYAYYVNFAPKDIHRGIGLSIGTIFVPVDDSGARMYKNTELRCEKIIGVQDKIDADCLEGRNLIEFKRIYIIKTSNINNEHCRFDEQIHMYIYNGLYFSPDNFWSNIVKYEYGEEEVNKVTQSALEFPKYKINIEPEATYNGEPLSIINYQPQLNINKEGEKTMEKNNIFGNVFKNMKFGKINTDKIKYSFNGIAFQTDSGDYVTYNSDFTFTNVSNMVIDMPMFAMPVSKTEIKVGDVINHNGDWVIVNSITDTEIKVAHPWNKEIVTVIPETSVFGFSFYIKIINILDGLNKTADESNPFGNLMPLLFLGDNDNSSNEILTFMMLNGKIDTINPMLMYALMGNKEDINPLMMLVLSGQNPFNSKQNKEPIIPFVLKPNEMTYTFSTTELADSLKINNDKINSKE